MIVAHKEYGFIRQMSEPARATPPINADDRSPLSRTEPDALILRADSRQKDTEFVQQHAIQMAVEDEMRLAGKWHAEQIYPALDIIISAATGVMRAGKYMSMKRMLGRCYAGA